MTKGMSLERATKIMLGQEKPGDARENEDRRPKVTLPVLKFLERPLPPDDIPHLPPRRRAPPPPKRKKEPVTQDRQSTGYSFQCNCCPAFLPPPPPMKNGRRICMQDAWALAEAVGWRLVETVNKRTKATNLEHRCPECA